MKSLSSRLLVTVGAVVVFGLSLPAYAATYTEFDPSGSVATYATAISGGAVAGFYYTKEGTLGFLRAADGTITTLGVPQASETEGQSINKAGSIAGDYVITSAVSHGFVPGEACSPPQGGDCSFVRTPDGTITTFNAPGCGATFAFGINASGLIVGPCEDSNLAFHGYVRAADGSFTVFDPTGSISTFPTSINESGAVTGQYQDSSHVTHGFVRAADGTTATFDAPQSTYTQGQSINNAGTITGYYIDTSNVDHGFVRTADGTITTFDPSGSTGTNPFSIANSGTVAGYYSDSSGVSHGFIRRPTGKIISFDFPGSKQTFPISIDSVRTDRNAITGYYEDSSGYHGFLRTP